MEIPPDTLEAVGVNELFVVVTVDVSFTTEHSVVGHIDEILIAVRTTTIVGYLSPSQICDACACRKGVCSLVCVNVFPAFFDMSISPR
jgi:hypothetical protein